MTSIDFGFRPTLAIGDRIWLDADGNGVQGVVASEPGFANVALSLVNRTSGVVVATVVAH